MINLTLQDALAQLRDYAADEVAELMLLAGKTGNVGDMTTCPVANYLQDVLGTECSVDTNVAWVSADYAPVVLPGGVQAFVDAFDSEAYPYLITDEDEY